MNDASTPSPGKFRDICLALFYAAILIAVFLLHARGGLEAPTFIYQGF